MGMPRIIKTTCLRTDIGDMKSSHIALAAQWNLNVKRDTTLYFERIYTKIGGVRHVVLVRNIAPKGKNKYCENDFQIMAYPIDQGTFRAMVENDVSLSRKGTKGKNKLTREQREKIRTAFYQKDSENLI